LKEFDRCVDELHLQGLKLHPFLHSYPIDSHPLLDPIFEKCAKADIPILCHGEGDCAFTTPAQFAEMANSFSDVNLIMSHMGFWQLTDIAIEKAKKIENLYLDTAMVSDPNVIHDAVDKAGANKVLMGTDTPGGSLSLELTKITMAVTDREKRALVTGGNMAHLLRID